MNALKTVGYIFSAILILFGVLMIIGATGSQGSPSWIIPGILLIAVGFGIIIILGIFFKKTADSSSQNQTTLEVNLPGDVNVERFKCADCGAQLTMDNVKMVAGAPMVECPYCDAAYQLTEEPKW